MADLDTYFKDHWVDIEPERLARYDKLFQLDDRRGDIILAPVGVREGETVVDFGCGPGFVAAQLARLTGSIHRWRPRHAPGRFEPLLYRHHHTTHCSPLTR